VSTFFDARTVVKAEDLHLPRVYSTDLLPSLYDPSDPAASVRVTARALKIKIITKGLVTLNSAYLISRLGVDLLDRHPDLLAGEAILPVFRTDKSSFADLIPSTADPGLLRIDEKRLQKHMSTLERLIT